MVSEQKETAVATLETNSNLSTPASEAGEPAPRPGLLKRATTIQPQKWPSQPEGLEMTRGLRIALDLWDLFFCALPVGLMIKTTLCIVAYKRDGKLDHAVLDYVSTMTKKLLYVNEQMVTVFTIIFVAIMATALRRFALWKAQHGAYLSDLELLHASISFPDTIKMIYFLRKFSYLTCSLFVVWCFYYLGCQAQVWEYTFALSGRWHKIQAAYSNDLAIFNFNATREEPGSVIDYVNTKMKLYLETPKEASRYETAGVDADGDVLIPAMRFERWLSSRAGKPARERPQSELQSWMAVHPTTETYVTGHGQKFWFNQKDLYKDASKAGSWGYAGPPNGEKVIGEYTFKTSYFNVQCDSVNVRTTADFPGNIAANMSTSINMTSSSSTANDTPTPGSFNIWHKWSPAYWADVGQTRSAPIINNQTSGSIQISCTLIRPDVEIQAKCSETACVPRKMRYLKDTANHQYTTPFDNSTWAAEFFDNLLWSTGRPEVFIGSITGETILERYLNLESFIGVLSDDSSSTTTTTTTTTTQSPPDINEILTSFSPNITRVLNTYFNIALSLGLPPPSTSPQLYTTNITFNGALYAPAFRLHWAWITMDYISCTLLLVASIWSFWLRKHTLAPDIFGYVSSLTRDNPHVPVEGGSALSGVDRAKLMSKIRIRIGNVGDSSEMGKIGIVYIHDDATVIPLDKHGKYL